MRLIQWDRAIRCGIYRAYWRIIWPILVKLSTTELTQIHLTAARLMLTPSRSRIGFCLRSAARDLPGSSAAIRGLAVIALILVGSPGEALAQSSTSGGAGNPGRGGYWRTSRIGAFSEIIQRYGESYGVDSALIAAVIKVESNGDPNARSRTGAMGLMQLMPGTCSDMGVSEPYNPEQNISGGTALLAKHLNHFGGDVEKALAAYNGGLKHAEDGSWRNNPETRQYVPAVIRIYRAFRSDSDSGPAYFATDQATTPQFPQSQTRSHIQPPVNNLGMSYTDFMFQVVSGGGALSGPDAPAENGGLDTIADRIVEETASGALRPQDALARVRELLQARRQSVSRVNAICFTTDNPEAYKAWWKSLPGGYGRFFGLSHSFGSSGHIWVTIAADLD